MVLLARALSPEDFGILALVVLVTRFAGILSEFGFSSAIIQAHDVSEAQKNSIFWCNVVLGLVVMGIVISVAGPVALFFKQPQIKGLIVLASVNFVLSSLGSTHRALLRRDLAFRSLGIIDVIGVLATGIAGVSLAYQGFGAKSLVLMEVVGNGVVLVSTLFAHPWIPRFVFRIKAVLSLSKFSANVLATNVVNYWIRNLDNLLIGKLLGDFQLGLYSRAYGLMLMPVSQISGVVGSVMFPSLSKIRSDVEKVRSIYLRATASIFLVTGPIMFGFAAVAEDVVPLLLGEHWSELVPIVQVLCPLGAFQSVLGTVGWIYLSQGRSDLMFKWTLGASPVIFASFYVGTLLGDAFSVALVYTLTNVVILAYPMVRIPGRLIGLTWGMMLNNLRGSFACSLGMCVGVMALGWMLPDGWSDKIRVAILVPTGALIYGTLVWHFDLRAYRDVSEIIRERLPKRSE